VATGNNETVTIGPINGSENVSVSGLDEVASIDLSAAVIEEARLLDSDGTVVDTDTTADLGACVELLGIELVDLDTGLLLDADVLDDLNDPNASALADLVAELDDTEIELLNEAVDTGEITNREIIDLARTFESGEVTPTELEDLLDNSVSDLGDALDSLLGGVLPLGAEETSANANTTNATEIEPTTATNASTTTASGNGSNNLGDAIGALSIAVVGLTASGVLLRKRRRD